MSEPIEEASPTAVAIFHAILPILNNVAAEDVHDAIMNVTARVIHVHAKHSGVSLEDAESWVDAICEDAKRALTINWSNPP